MASPTAPVISSTGITAPTFAQIYAYLQGQYLAIFGADALITPDTQDGQLLAVFAQAISDANSAAIAVYNSFSPATAQGAGLSSNVQINGLTRLVASYSIALCNVTGIPQTVITNGQLIDPAGNIWVLTTVPNQALPPVSTPVTIAGTGNVIAQCSTPGAINVGVNQLKINTPTFGWTGVTNAAATVGAPVETDAALRVRQAQSVSLPSLTIFEGIVASIAQVTGVTRVKGYENNTSSGLGLPGGSVLPANNLLFVVEGGAPLAVATAIFEKITPGIPTWNSGGVNNVNQTVTDANGSTRVVNFQTAIEAGLNVNIGIHPLNGWTVSTESLILNALTAYFASAPIGSNISYFGLINVISLLGTPQQGTFEITALTLNGATTDTQLNYNYAPVVSGVFITLT